MQTQHRGDSHRKQQCCWDTFSLMQRTVEAGVHILMGLLPSFPSHICLSFLGYSHSPPKLRSSNSFISLPSLPMVPYFLPQNNGNQMASLLVTNLWERSAYIYSIYSGSQTSNYYLLNLHFPTWEPPDPYGC